MEDLLVLVVASHSSHGFCCCVRRVDLRTEVSAVGRTTTSSSSSSTTSPSDVATAAGFLPRFGVLGAEDVDEVLVFLGRPLFGVSACFDEDSSDVSGITLNGVARAEERPFAAFVSGSGMSPGVLPLLVDLREDTGAVSSDSDTFGVRPRREETTGAVSSDSDTLRPRRGVLGADVPPRAVFLVEVFKFSG